MNPRGGVSARAVALGLVCSALLCAITPTNDFKIAATYLSGNQFPIGAIFVLIVLAGGVNVLLRRTGRARAAFTQKELLTIWALILVAAGLPGSGMMRFFIPQIVAVHFYSDNVNNWEAKIWGGLPSYLKITDKAAVDAFFRGYPRGQERIPWEAWAVPLLAWGILAMLFLVASFCVANLLRQQWVENEKFAFPLVTLPVLLADEPAPGRMAGDLWGRPLLWVGVGLTTVLHTTRGLHQLYPSVPDLPFYVNLMDFLTVTPYNQLGPFEIWVYPLVIGLTYLLAAEVSFSLWFFYLFFKGEILLGALYNWQMDGALAASSQKQFHGLQVFGGALALLTWTLWTARRHLRDVWEKATSGPRAGAIDDTGELIGYRASVLGLALAYGGIGLWQYGANVSPGMIALSLLILTMVLVTVSWMVCQAGMLFLPTAYSSIEVLAGPWGTARFSIPGLYSVARFEGMFLSGTREMVAPSVLNSLKAVDAAAGTGFFPRRLLIPLAASVVIGLVVSAVASLALPYHNGGANSLPDRWMYTNAPQRPLRFLGGAASVPYVGAWTNGLHVAGGLAGVLGLLTLRAQVGWGLHPIGFLAASTYAAQVLWFSQLAGWILKGLIQRYGGMKGYTAALPLFLGLIVGDVLNAVVWIVVGALTGVGYRLMPA